MLLHDTQPRKSAIVWPLGNGFKSKSYQGRVTSLWPRLVITRGSPAISQPCASPLNLSPIEAEIVVDLLFKPEKIFQRRRQQRSQQRKTHQDPKLLNKWRSPNQKLGLLEPPTRVWILIIFIRTRCALFISFLAILRPPCFFPSLIRCNLCAPSSACRSSVRLTVAFHSLHNAGPTRLIHFRWRQKTRCQRR
jgi:hypothetical protein